MSAVMRVASRDPEGVPARVAVIQRIVPETPESSTFWSTWRDGDGDGYAFEPGQFNMLYLFGVGEIPISISSDPAHPQRLGHTIRWITAIRVESPSGSGDATARTTALTRSSPPPRRR